MGSANRKKSKTSGKAGAKKSAARRGALSLVAAERILRNYSGKEAYVIVTPSQLSYLRYNGMAPPGAAEELTRSLERSRDFKVVFRTGGSEIFRFTGNGGTS